MIQTIEIDGQPQDIDIPNDATSDEVDQIVNEVTSQPTSEPAKVPELRTSGVLGVGNAALRYAKGLGESWNNRIEGAGAAYGMAPTKAEGVLRAAGEFSNVLPDAVMPVLEKGAQALNNLTGGYGSMFGEKVYGVAGKALNKALGPREVDMGRMFPDRPEMQGKKGTADLLGAAGDMVKAVPDRLAKDVGAGANLALNATMVTPAKSIVGPAVKGLGEATAAVTGLVPKAAHVVNKQLGRAAEEMSGVSEEALRKAGTKAGREAIQAQAGKAMEVGQKLVTMLDNPNEFLPEAQEIHEALAHMPKVNLQNVYDAMEAAKTPNAVERTVENVNKRLAEAQERLKNLTGVRPDGTLGDLTALEYRDVRNQFDKVISWDSDEDALYDEALKGVRATMKQDLLDAAAASGNARYASAMESYADKIEKILAAKKLFGSNSQMRGWNAEVVMKNIFNSNKTARRDALQAVEGVFGTDFLSQAKLAQLANQLGDTGKATWLPRQHTGRSVMASAVGAVGAKLLGGGPVVSVAAPVAVASLASPKIASRVTLPAAEGVAKGLTKAQEFMTKERTLGRTPKVPPAVPVNNPPTGPAPAAPTSPAPAPRPIEPPPKQVPPPAPVTSVKSSVTPVPTELSDKAKAAISGRQEKMVAEGAKVLSGPEVEASVSRILGPKRARDVRLNFEDGKPLTKGVELTAQEQEQVDRSIRRILGPSRPKDIRENIGGAVSPRDAAALRKAEIEAGKPSTPSVASLYHRMGKEGGVNPKLLTNVVAPAAVGGVAGSQVGDTPEERAQNAAVGALLGAAIPNVKSIKGSLKGLGEEGSVRLRDGAEKGIINNVRSTKVGERYGKEERRPLRTDDEGTSGTGEASLRQAPAQVAAKESTGGRIHEDLTARQALKSNEDAVNWLKKNGHYDPSLEKYTGSTPTPTSLMDPVVGTPEFKTLSPFDRAKILATLERPFREKLYLPTGRVETGNLKTTEIPSELSGRRIRDVDPVSGCTNNCINCYALGGATQGQVTHNVPVKKTLTGKINDGEILRNGVNGDPATDWAHSATENIGVYDRSLSSGADVNPKNNTFAITKLQKLEGYDPEVFPNLEVSVDPLQPEHMYKTFAHIDELKKLYGSSVNMVLRIRSYASNNPELRASLDYAADRANELGLPVLETKMRWKNNLVADALDMDKNKYVQVGGQLKMKSPALKEKVKDWHVCDAAGTGKCSDCRTCESLMFGTAKAFKGKSVAKSVKESAK